MNHELTASEVREEIAEICSEFLKQSGRGEVVKVTHYGKPAIAMIPWTMFESMLETLAVLEDAEFMSRLKQSLRQMKRGSGKSWEDFKKERSFDA